LDEARAKFEVDQIPRREGHGLLILINNANKIAEHFKPADPELSDVFEQQLPKVGQLMRTADVFYEQESLQYGLCNQSEVPPIGISVVHEACKEMERAAGKLSAYAVKYRHENSN